MGVRQKPVSARKFGELSDRYLTARLELTAQLNLTANLNADIHVLKREMETLKASRAAVERELNNESAALARLAKECSQVRRESERRGQLLKVIGEMTHVGA
jgi:septal ring factor EnvC (AmiA/AmiB activator)